jgi:NAD(P)-dependent dehydrogenase (short-subunit alcohol dehydrogenase family)
MKSIDNMTILVTGSTDGIGMLTATQLAKLGAKVIVHGRSSQKLTRVMNSIKANSSNSNIDGYIADFNALNNVRELASKVLNNHPKLDVLINNAGIGLTGKRKVSQDGYELRFAINYLAPFLLTHLLIPALKEGIPSRIVNVASIGQHPIDFDDIMLEENFDPHQAYRQSKLALIMFTFTLAEKIKDTGITVNALHPGTYLDTKMVTEAGITAMGRAEDGAKAEVYLATSSDLSGISGQYFDRMEISKAIRQAYDSQAREKLWSLSMKFTDLQ